MSCPCGYHFCWVCSGFFDHKTYQHSCGKYKEEEHKEEARKSLQRYLHYFHRYTAHAESRKKEGKVREGINEKISAVSYFALFHTANSFLLFYSCTN